MAKKPNAGLSKLPAAKKGESMTGKSGKPQFPKKFSSPAGKKNGPAASNPDLKLSLVKKAK